jgi:HEAT repeat protein
MPATEELRQTAAKWGHDRFVPVRREALALLAERFPDSARPALNESLFDRNATVRGSARFYLRALGVTDFAALYREALGASVRDRASTLRGLGETGDREDVDAVLPFLEGTGPAIRRASVEALGALDRDGQLGRLVALLGDAAPGVSREARTALEDHAVGISAEPLWTAFEGTPFLHAKRNLLAVMARLARWESLPCLVGACGVREQTVARTARTALERWLAGYNRRFFSRPTPSQRERLREALRSARGYLPDSAAAELDEIVQAAYE